MERYELMGKENFKNELDLFIIKTKLGEKEKVINIALKRSKIVVLSHILGILSVYDRSFVQKYTTDYYMSTICKIKDYKVDILPSYQDACDKLGLNKKNYLDIAWICDKFGCDKNIYELRELLMVYNKRFN